MADLSAALEFVLPHEGGFSNHAADKGGATMWGITEATARRYGYTGPMQELPLEVAEAIYGNDYWPGLEGVTNQAVASKILDMRVNFGVTGGNKLAQAAVNELVEPATAVDGKWGEDTLSSINAADPAALLDALATASAARYQAIAEKDPSQEVFLRGWMKRALDLPTWQAVAAGAGGLLVLLAIGALIFMSGAGKGRA